MEKAATRKTSYDSLITDLPIMPPALIKDPVRRKRANRHMGQKWLLNAPGLSACILTSREAVLKDRACAVNILLRHDEGRNEPQHIAARGDNEKPLRKRFLRDISDRHLR